MAGQQGGRGGQTPRKQGQTPRPQGAKRDAKRGDGPQGLLTLVCLTCGNHKDFEENPPASLTCERCGGTVFRNFFTPTEADEATISQLEETARSIALDEESPDTSPDEVRDLNNP